MEKTKIIPNGYKDEESKIKGDAIKKEIKKKLQKMLDLADEIYYLDKKSISLYLAPYHHLVIFEKDSNERNTILNLISNFKYI